MTYRYLITFASFKGKTDNKEELETEDLYEAIAYVDFLRINSGGTWIESEVFEIINELKKSYPDIYFNLYRDEIEIYSPDFAFPKFKYLSSNNDIEEAKYELYVIGDDLTKVNTELENRIFKVGPNPVDEKYRETTEDGLLSEEKEILGTYTMTYEFTGPYEG